MFINIHFLKNTLHIYLLISTHHIGFSLSLHSSVAPLPPFTANQNMKENGHSEENSSCYFHPKQVVVGVCPLCLNERLLILAAKQGHSASKSSHRLQSSKQRKPSASIHKIFALGSLFSRPESQQPKSENYDLDASPSPEGNSLFHTLLDNVKFYSCSYCYSSSVLINKNKIMEKGKFILDVVKSASILGFLFLFSFFKFSPCLMLRWVKGLVIMNNCLHYWRRFSCASVRVLIYMQG